MAKKSSKDKKIRLQSTESHHFYTTVRNPKLEKKLELKKYDPVLRKHVIYKEAKIKK